MDNTNQRAAKEAERRMRMLGIAEDVISEFMNSRKIFCSRHDEIEGKAFPLILYPSAGNRLGNMVAKAEAYLKKVDPNAVPYHATTHRMKVDGQYMEICNILYVSGNPAEWPVERIKHQTQSGRMSMVYCLAYNATRPEYSDFGFCSFHQSFGGLIRTA